MLVHLAFRGPPSLACMASTITVVLPIDDDERTARSLAPGLPEGSRHRLGAVDNGLWRSMPILLAHLEHAVGSPLVARLRFDHLSPDFDAQQRSLRPFAADVAGAVTGLGN